ncbi:MAG TPA: hypothetical protein VH988_11235 [Thermoanaerobaculia bacterium]|jgi:hypothetical protein|nr:hypothetical protein [Thermoanaerobaculia bacterium]
MKRILLCGVAVLLFTSAMAPKQAGACPITPCNPIQCRNSCGPSGGTCSLGICHLCQCSL